MANAPVPLSTKTATLFDDGPAMPDEVVAEAEPHVDQVAAASGNCAESSDRDAETWNDRQAADGQGESNSSGDRSRFRAARRFCYYGSLRQMLRLHSRGLRDEFWHEESSMIDNIVALSRVTKVVDAWKGWLDNGADDEERQCIDRVKESCLAGSARLIQAVLENELPERARATTDASKLLAASEYELLDLQRNMKNVQAAGLSVALLRDAIEKVPLPDKNDSGLSYQSLLDGMISEIRELQLQLDDGPAAASARTNLFTTKELAALNEQTRTGFAICMRTRHLAQLLFRFVALHPHRVNESLIYEVHRLYHRSLEKVDGLSLVRAMISHRYRYLLWALPAGPGWLSWNLDLAALVNDDVAAQ